MKYTSESLLDLPPIDYLTMEEARLDLTRVVSAGMSEAVITNPTSKFPIASTNGLCDCLGIIAVNNNTQTTLVSHVMDNGNDGLALRRVINLVRRKPSDDISLYFIGAAADEIGWQQKPQGRDKWNARIENIAAELNEHSNIEVKGFDVGSKPHPTGVAVQWHGKEYKIVRLNEFVQDVYVAANRGDHLSVFEPMLDKGTDQIAQPFLTWDGRLPENQIQNRSALKNKVKKRSK